MDKVDALKDYIREHIAETVILVLMAATYLPWLQPFGYLVSGDWAFHYPSFLKGFAAIPKVWESYNNLGGVDAMPTGDAIKVLYGILSHFVSFGIAERLLY